MRTIALEGSISGTDASDYFTLKRALVEAYGINSSNELQIRAWDSTERKLDAYVTTSPMIVESAGEVTIGRYRVELRCPDPFFKALTALTGNTGTAVTGGSPVAMTVPSPLGSGGGSVEINNVGDVSAYAEFTFTGSVTNPTVTNLANSDAFTVNETLSGGDSLRVYRDNTGFFVLLNGVSIMSSFSGTFFLIETGVNTLKFTATTSDATANMAVEFYPRYKSL